MTREQVLKLFPEATPEQITGILNQNNSEIENEKNKAKQYKEKADKADDLQKQLDDLETKGLSDIEKVNKQLEAATAEIAKLQKEKTISDMRSNAATKFKVSAEQAAQIVKDDGSFDYDILGKIIADKEVAAAQAKEKEIANNSTNPGGGSGNGGAGGEDDKPADLANAEHITFGSEMPKPEMADFYKI